MAVMFAEDAEDTNIMTMIFITGNHFLNYIFGLDINSFWQNLGTK